MKDATVLAAFLKRLQAKNVLNIYFDVLQSGLLGIYDGLACSNPVR